MGCTVDTVTLSYEQKMMTEQRASERGLSDRVRVHLCDYRDLPPSFEHAFDALVSCEMVEVGPVPVPFSIRASDLPLTVRTGGGAQLPEAVRPRYRLGSQRGSGDDGHHGDQPARISVYRLSVSLTARLPTYREPSTSVIARPNDFARHYHWPNCHLPSATSLANAVQEGAPGKFTFHNLEDHGPRAYSSHV